MIDLSKLEAAFEQVRMWGSIRGCEPAERALQRISDQRAEVLDKLLSSDVALPKEQIRAAYNVACKYVPSENMVMERAHAVLFDRIEEELQHALGDADSNSVVLETGNVRGARLPNRAALCSYVFHDAKLYLGSSHPLVVDAGVTMLVQFKVDVKEKKMCYACDRHTYPCNAKTEIEHNGKNGDQECSRCGKAYVEQCAQCNQSAIPDFISEAGSGVPGGQLFCSICKEDHGVKRSCRRYCVSCKSGSFMKRRGGVTSQKYNCFVCGSKMTEYCRDCKRDALIVRWGDGEPRCSICKDTFQAITIRHASEIHNRERAQEKLAHVGRWIKTMWTGDFFSQVYMVWAKGAIDRLMKRRLMKKMLSRVLNRKKSEGFQGWLEVVNALQKRRIDAIIQIDIMLSSSTREKTVFYYSLWKDEWGSFKSLTDGQKEARRLFDIFDTNLSGVISLQELQYRMSDWGYDDNDINHVMMKVDLNNDGCVSWDEFLQAYDFIREHLGLANLE